MTREEAVFYIMELQKTYASMDKKVAEAVDMATEALSEPKTGEWIFNPKDAIELMFTLPKCSECGFESADCGNFCSNCGARMIEKDDEA